MEFVSDFLVLGTGIAGLSFAIKASTLGTVNMVTKKEKSESNTNYAQGGIAVVLDERDSFADHIQDTMICGGGLCNEDTVRFVIAEGPERIREFVRWGVDFTPSAEASSGYDLGREGGHSRRRVLHAGDMTGQKIEEALQNQVGQSKNIRIFENHISIDLITDLDFPHNTSSQRRCLGAYVYDINHDEVHVFRARFVIMATGGAGKVYLITTNPDIATGDGVAMAYRAGADILNMEFIQFHPTCLYHPDAKSFLISEAVRGEGGILKLRSGKEFMKKYHPMESLAPRDIVAQAIDTELKTSGEDHVLLDITHRGREFIVNRFPGIYEKCLEFGFDMAVNQIPVAPAAHYMCGGVAVNAWGETNIQNLFALGEVACTGLHGANRLASNSLLEAIVFAHRAFIKICDLFPAPPLPDSVILPWNPRGATESDESIVVSHNWDEVRRCMSNYVGIVRSDKRLARARRRIDMVSREIDEYYRHFLITKDLIELRNITTVAAAIVECAMERKESRGLHYTIDYPQKNDQDWQKDTRIRKPVN